MEQFVDTRLKVQVVLTIVFGLKGEGAEHYVVLGELTFVATKCSQLR